jgi:hypothetical protein
MQFLTKAWILLSALIVAAGWLLSICHQLSAVGYCVFGLVALPVCWKLMRREGRGVQTRQQTDAKLRKRLNRPAPLLFVLLASLSFISGILYPALNWDANAYRLPRLLHWLGTGHWHWIHTADARMNITDCNSDWLMAPLLLSFQTEHLLFVINWISYLLLPGLIFSVFTRCQVRPRAAWWWMWFLPAGWCFAFQASSVANDSLGAVYALAAVDFALRARTEQKIFPFLWSLLAVALATGIKQTNLPLVLVWLVAAWPCRILVVRNQLKVISVGSLALLVSVVPISVLNWMHAGSWLPVDNPGIAKLGSFHLNPFWGIVGNTFCVTVQNLVPPLYQWFPPYYDALGYY